MLAQARCGQHAEARVTVGNRLTLAAHGPNLHESDRRGRSLSQVGCAFALCAVAVPPDFKERQRFQDKSSAALSQALERGFGRLHFLERDPDSIRRVRAPAFKSDWRDRNPSATGVGTKSAAWPIPPTVAIVIATTMAPIPR